VLARPSADKVVIQVTSATLETTSRMYASRPDHVCGRGRFPAGCGAGLQLVERPAVGLNSAVVIDGSASYPAGTAHVT
jgi:hypothetical protein